MNEFMKTLLSLSLSGTLLFSLVSASKHLYRERFSRRWQYDIWLVVALRFLLPFAPGVTFTGYLFDRMEALPALSDSATIRSVDENQDSDSVEASGSRGVTGSDSPDAPGNSMTRPQSSDSMQGFPDAGDSEAWRSSAEANGILGFAHQVRSLPCFHAALFSLWLITATALLVRKAAAYHGFLDFLKSTSTPVSDIETLNLLAHSAESLRIRKTVELCTTPLISSPILTGFFRPRILLPGGEIPGQRKDLPGSGCTQSASPKPPFPQREALSYIFTHELIHYKRRDMFYKWFIQVLLCIHWFNPFAYLLAKETARACELACDEAVAAGLDGPGKKAYGDTLLAFLRPGGAHKSPLASITLTEGGKELKERLGAIMKSQKKTKTMTLLTALSTAAICTAFCTLGAYAKSVPDAAPEPGGYESAALPSDHSPSFEGHIPYEYDNGVYYLYKDGADRHHKPLVSFTGGCLGITLVGRDGYSSLGPFDWTTDGDALQEQIVQICRDMVSGKSLTPEDAGIILMWVEERKDNIPPLSRPEADDLSEHPSGSFQRTQEPEIAHNTVEIRFYSDGSPYLHSTFLNRTDRTIAELEYCLLAYDADGHPLKLVWDFLDSSAEAGYENLVRQRGLQLRPGQSTDGYPGGWSLQKEDAGRISYVLSCLKEVVFEDGSTWSDPAYESWRETYVGKEIDTRELQSYYPREYAATD